MGWSESLMGVEISLAVVGVLLIVWVVLYVVAMYLQEVKSFKRVNLTRCSIFVTMWMVGSFLASIPCLLVFWDLKKVRAWAHINSTHLANFMYATVFGTLIVEGEENLLPDGKPVIYVANHQSCIDISVVYRVDRKFAWVSKSSVFTVPGVGIIMRLARYISITRGSSESGQQMMADCQRCLESGYSVVFFPQGTRRRYKILDFKHGAFTLAAKMKIPVVPLTIDLPETVWLWGCKETPRLVVHEPIMPDDKLFEDVSALQQHSFKVVVNGLKYGPSMLQQQQESKLAEEPKKAK